MNTPVRVQVSTDPNPNTALYIIKQAHSSFWRFPSVIIGLIINYHSLSVNTIIMVSNNCLNIGKQVMDIFSTK